MEPELTRELEKKIGKSVRKILKEKNWYEMTEKKVREMASKDLQINLSDEPFKSIVSRAVEDLLVKFKTQTQNTSLQLKEKKRSK